MNKLSKYLKHRGKSQKWFADKLGTTPTHLGRLIKGECQPSLKTAYEIEKLSGGLVTLYDWLPDDQGIDKKENKNETYYD